MGKKIINKKDILGKGLFIAEIVLTAALILVAFFSFHYTDFSDSLDGLIFLKYSDFPQKTIRAILRGLPDALQDEVWMHFYGTSRTE